MSTILRNLPTPALVNAIEENLFAFFPHVRCMPQSEVHDGPDLLWSVTNFPLAVFNSVLRARLAPEDVDAAVQAAVARCQSRHVNMMWWTGPSTRPADLGATLELHGFEHHSPFSGMAADLCKVDEDAPIPSSARVLPVTDRDTLRQWIRARTAGFEGSVLGERAWWEFCTGVGLDADQPFRYYYALLDGVPVAASMLFLAAGVAGVYSVATAPEARRKGLGGAVTSAALREARTLGYHVGILHASEMGESVYRRMGFQEYCTIGVYVWRARP